MPAVPKKIPWTRVGVMHDDHSEFKQILGIGASKDGGIMISPVGLAGSTNWSYGRARVPTGAQIGMSGRPMSATVRRSDGPPKLHYHRSGWLSVNLTGKAERVSLKALPTRFLSGAQFFTFVLTRPDLLPTTKARQGSLIGVIHDAWPAAVVCNGFAIARSRVRSSVLAQMNSDPVGLVADGHQPELLLDLAPHGLETVVAIRFEYDDESHLGIESVQGYLYGYDTKWLDLDGMCDVVGTWTDDDMVKLLGLTPMERRPFQVLGLDEAVAPLQIEQRIRWPEDRA